MRTCLVPFIISYLSSPRAMATLSAALSWLRIEFFLVESMELCRHRRGQGGHATCGFGGDLLRGTQCVPVRQTKR